jgi:hypothetical protein
MKYEAVLTIALEGSARAITEYSPTPKNRWSLIKKKNVQGSCVGINSSKDVCLRVWSGDFEKDYLDIFLDKYKFELDEPAYDRQEASEFTVPLRGKLFSSDKGVVTAAVGVEGTGYVSSKRSGQLDIIERIRKRERRKNGETQKNLE